MRSAGQLRCGQRTGEYLRLGDSEAERQQAYRDSISNTLPIEVIQKIRHCLNTGLVLARIIHEEINKELYKSLSCVKIVFANSYLNTKKAFA